MLLHTTTPFRLASLYWRSKSGQWMHTLIAKITYHILPGQCKIAEAQEDIHTHDNHWDDDPNKSLFAPCDLVPCKPRADILLVGHAFAPPPNSTHSFTARLSFADKTKSIEIHSDRIFNQHGHLLAGEPLRKMSLRYERAAFDADTNPVGRKCEPPNAKTSQRPLPNLQPPNTHIASANYRIAPIGFGPLAPHWSARKQFLANLLAEQWAFGGWAQAPMPEGLEQPFFNSAPTDQQADTIRPDCTIVLENLHPEYPLLKTRLGGHLPRALIERPNAAPTSFQMHGDTLWIDTDRALCTLTFRWQFAVENPDQPGRIQVTSETMDSRASHSDIHLSALMGSQYLAQSSDDGQTTPAPNASPNSIVLPFAKGLAQAQPAFTASQNPHAHGRRPPRDLSATQTVAPPHAHSVRELPFRSFPPLDPNVLSEKSKELISPAPMPAEPVPETRNSPPVARPSLVSKPTLAVETQAEAGFSGIAAKAPSNAAPVLKKGRAAKPVVASNAQLKEAKQSALPESAEKASNSALDANAAKFKEPEPRPSGESGLRPIPRMPRVCVELLGFGAAYIDRIRKQYEWKDILSNLRPKARDADAEGENAPERSRKEAKDRRDISGILAMGTPESPAALKARMADAVDEDGMFVPPLVLLAGELEVAFDRLEYLKTLMCVVAPLAASDKALKEVLDSIGELIKTNVLRSSGKGAENQAGRIRELFGQGQKAQLLQQLDAQVAQMLLEERQFQRKTFSAQAFVKATLHAQGPEGSAPLPIYLNDEIAKELPLYQRFSARVIGELRPPQEGNESLSCALYAIALGRVLPESMLRA